MNKNVSRWAIALLTVGTIMVATSSLARAQETTKATSAKAAKTFLGPDGVESNAIIDENRKAGTTSWRLAASPATGFIDGFSGENYVTNGNDLDLYVSTSDPSFHVDAYRMGYYGGAGGRLVWSSGKIAGAQQPPCALTRGVNMVSCDHWNKSLVVSITPSFMQGDYLFKLIGRGGQQSYIPLTVWDPSSTAAYLLVARTLTEQGWNTYGGYDYYQGLGPCPAGSSTYPACNRARVVSFDRPITEGRGASDFLGNEYPLIYWAEQHGLDVAYATDVTLSEHPNVMANHRAILSLGHDETWTNAERVGALSALARGTNIVFFGAAALVRHSRLQASPLGADREEVDYRDAASDPLNAAGQPMQVTGNTWASPPTNWSEVTLTGEGYAGFGEGNLTFPFVVYDASSWLFKGTQLKDGSSIPGVIKSDVDHASRLYATPANLQLLGHSPLPTSKFYTNQGEWSGYTYSDATYWTDTRSKGGVFDSGTVNWIDAMETCTSRADCPAPLLQKITGNLLHLFGRGPAGDFDPSKGNFASVRPAGS